MSIMRDNQRRHESSRFAVIAVALLRRLALEADAEIDRLRQLGDPEPTSALRCRDRLMTLLAEAIDEAETRV